MTEMGLDAGRSVATFKVACLLCTLSAVFVGPEPALAAVDRQQVRLPVAPSPETCVPHQVVR